MPSGSGPTPGASCGSTSSGARHLARGNATNIFFSEGSGAVPALRTPEADPAFAIAAHEAAHQWWGHIMAPGEGPGGIVLAEGAANFSTLMLLEQMRGFQPRMSFATRWRATYGERRQPEHGEAAGRDAQHRRPPRGRDRGLRQGRLGALDADAPDGARAASSPAPATSSPPIRQAGPGPSRDRGLRGRPAPLRGGQSRPSTTSSGSGSSTTVIPEYRLDGARKRPLGTGQWEVTVRGRRTPAPAACPVEVAAIRGQRFDEKGAIDPDYRDARATVVLGRRRVEGGAHPLHLRARAGGGRSRRLGAPAPAAGGDGEALIFLFFVGAGTSPNTVHLRSLPFPWLTKEETPPLS